MDLRCCCIFLVVPSGLSTHHHTPGTHRVLQIHLVEGVPTGLHDGRADDAATITQNSRFQARRHNETP